MSRIPLIEKETPRPAAAPPEPMPHAMTPEQYKHAAEVFHAVRALPRERWSGALNDRCPGSDPASAAVRAEVESLLSQPADRAEFLERPATAQGAAVAVAEMALAAGDAAPDSGALVGTRVGVYTVSRLIGAGGMGAVYEAEQDHPRRTVALKVMSALASPGAVRRFEYESELLARLRHPGIAQVYAAGTHAGPVGLVPYFAMEYVDGAVPITAYAARRGLAMRARLELLVKVCDAVHHGHVKGVVHRDLKPANILVDTAGQSKVIDFGVARAVDAGAARTALHTGVGQLVGTLAYMSPEQCDAPADGVDARSDVYSLGVVLYELLTARLPHDVGTRPIPDAVRIVRDEAPRRPSAVDPALRGDLETLVLKAMEKDRARRYQSAAEFGADIRRYLADQPIEARPPGALHQARLFARRNRALVVTTAVAAAVVTGVLVGATAVSLGFAWRARERAREADAARARAERAADFLKSALGSANPFVHSRTSPGVLESDFNPWSEWREIPWAFAGRPGERATVRDVLVGAGGRLDAEFGPDPAVRADLARTLGWALFRLGDLGSAGPLLRSAVDQSRAAFGDDDERTTRAVLRLAEFDDNAALPEEAEGLYRGALGAARRVFGPFDTRTLHVERSLANNLCYLLHRRDEAVALLSATVEAARREGRDSAPAMCQQRAYLARVDAAAPDRVARAAAALEAAERSAGPASVVAAYVHDQHGLVLMDAGRFEESAAERARAAEIWSAAFGRESMEAAGSLAGQAASLAEGGQFERAAGPARDVHDIYLRLRGPDDWETLNAGVTLAGVLVRAGVDLEAAEQIAADTAEHGAHQGAGPPNPLTISATLWRVEALARLGRPKDGLAVLEPLMPAVTDSAGALPWAARGSILYERGTLLAQAGDSAGARRSYEQCLSLASDPDHPAPDLARKAAERLAELGPDERR